MNPIRLSVRNILLNRLSLYMFKKPLLVLSKRQRRILIASVNLKICLDGDKGRIEL